MRTITAIVLLTASFAMANAPKKPPPLEPMHLSFTMTEDRAHAALTRAKLSPKRDERRAYFAKTDPDAPVVHTSEPELHWKLADGRAEARFKWSDAAVAYVLDEVAFYRKVSGKALSAELAALEKRHGKPTKATPESILWVRDGVWLVVVSSKDEAPADVWHLIVRYRKDDRPAP
jgi:hypothetical protein